MAWEFEKVYEVTPPSAPNRLAFDGRYLWVTGTNAVYVYEFFGYSSGNEPAFETIDSLTIDQFDSTKFTLIDIISIPSGSFLIVKSHGSMYISDAYSATILTKVNLATRTITKTITLPETMASNLVFENNKIWMGSKLPKAGSDRQLLYFYDIAADSFNFTEIPTRKQLAQLAITSGLNGFMYVANFNNFAVCKFDSTTGAFIKSIRINAFPQQMISTPNQEVYVSSYAGMLSKIDSSDTASNSFSTLDTVISMAYEPNSTNIWFLNSAASGTRIGRLNTADNSVFFSAPASDVYILQDDWELSLAKFSDKAFSRINIVPGFSYQQLINNVWTTINVKPYMFLIGATKIMAVRLDRPLYRELDLSVQGRAMISSGPEDYMGEIG
jgi:hypothetical protein